jgi:hypothetical protein
MEIDTEDIQDPTIDAIKKKLKEILTQLHLAILKNAPKTGKTGYKFNVLVDNSCCSDL